MLLNNIISIKQPLIPLNRIFYKGIASGGLNHRLNEGIGCRLNTDLTGSGIGFVLNFERWICDLSGLN
jgi:hypothetical protein